MCLVQWILDMQLFFLRAGKTFLKQNISATIKMRGGGRKNILRWSLQHIYSFCLGGGRKYIVGSKRLCELGTNGRMD